MTTKTAASGRAAKTSTRLTYAQFDHLIRRGVFESIVPRLEMYYGEVVIMPEPKPKHEDLVDEVAEWSFRSLPEGAARVRVQQSLGIPGLDSLTNPDVAWMRRRDYSENRPLAEDVLLLIEVAPTTLSRDRGKKAKLYAKAGIADDWIVNTRDRCIEVRRDPVGDTYRTALVLKPGQEARPLAFPDVALPVARLFPA